MNKPRIPYLILVLKVIGYCLACSMFSFAYGAFLAHEKGLEHTAFWTSTWRSMLHYLPFYALFFPASLLIHYLTTEMCRPDEVGTPVEDGKVIWKHKRLLYTVLFVPVIIAMSSHMINHITEKHSVDWGNALMIIMFLTVLIQYWLRPNQDKLYVLSTGDTSRINDERAHQVQGKAAISTLNILWYISISGGLLYEMAVLGTWPVRTTGAILFISLIQGIATRYWDKRL